MLARAASAVAMAVAGMLLATPAGAITAAAPTWLPGPGGPDGRAGAALAYDGATGDDVLFGGITDDGVAPSANDTWLWNGHAWAQAHPSISPSPRTAATMAYDAASKQLLLFGGGNSTEDGALATQSDTWVWSGSRWSQLHPAATPLGRLAASMAYDPGNGTVVLFGGADAAGDGLSDTWVWNGRSWHQAHPATSPERRVNAMMASDPATGDVVLFGGVDGAGQTDSDTWSWDGTNWSQLDTPTTPPARSAAVMDFDASLGSVVLAGGSDAAAGSDGLSSPIGPDGAGGTGGVLADTWSFNGHTWSPIATGATGPAVADASGAFDVASSQFVLFGGEAAAPDDSDPATTAVTQPVDTWLLTGGYSGLTRVAGSTGADTAVAVSRSAFSSGSAKAVVLAAAGDTTDALTGGPLAGYEGGPLLLTDPVALTASVRTEIQRVLPAGGTVYLLGGTDALAPAVDAALTAAGYHPQRLAGADRFATAVAIAGQMGHPSTVFETAAADVADALSGVPAAIEDRAPILLTDGAKPATATTAYLDADKPARLFALGGQAAAADPTATAIAGADRYATAALIAHSFFAAPSVIGFAATSTDALAAGVDLGAHGGPLLLVPGSGPLPTSIASYLEGVKASVSAAELFGGTSALTPPLADQIGVALS